MSFHYQAYGFGIASDWPLPALLPGTGAVAVTFTRGEVPETLDHVERRTGRWIANPTEMLLTFDGAGRFLVRDGQTVTYAPDPEADEMLVESVLLGSCLGAILHQCGRLVLHGAVVASGGKAFAICANSGRGKSTTSSHLIAQGAEFLSDDLAVFDEGLSLVQPGYPQAKLTSEAVDRLAIEAENLRTVPGERDKRAIPRGEDFLDHPLPLAGVFFLELTQADEPSIVRIEPGLVAQYLLRHTYRHRLVLPSLAESHFARCTDVAYRIPAWQVLRPKAGDSTAQVVSSISKMIAQQTDFPVETSQ